MEIISKPDQMLIVDKDSCRNRQKDQQAVDLAYACQYCDRPFDFTAHRWLCPHCHAKNTCCQ